MDIRSYFWYMILLRLINISVQTCTVRRGRPTSTHRYYFEEKVLECNDLITSFDIPSINKTHSYNDQIRTVEIRRSNFTILQADTFRSEDIQSITISDTSLRIIKPGFYNPKYTGKLDHLCLSHNNISSITKEVFNNMTNLKVLDLLNNSIESIESGSFSGSKIQMLYLEHNKIQDMSTVVENYCTYEILDLSFNYIKNIFPLYNCTSLRTLSLSNNNIVQLLNRVFPTVLGDLELGSNQIEIVEMDAFALSKLDTLDLSNNSLYKISNGSIPLWLSQQLNTVRIFNLSRNGLTHFSPETFKGWRSLTILDLNYNNLTYLPTGLLNDLQLRSLHITGNQFTELGNNFYNNYPKYGISIEMDDNQWTCDYLAQRIYQIFTVNFENSIKRGKYTDTPNINGIKCTPTKVMDDYTINISSNQSYVELVRKMEYSIEDLEMSQDETNKHLVDIQEKLYSIISRLRNVQHFPNESIYNMAGAIAKNSKLISNISRSVRTYQEMPEGRKSSTINPKHGEFLSEYLVNLELSELSYVRVFLLSILVANISLIAFILVVFGCIVYRYHRNAQFRIPHDIILESY